MGGDNCGANGRQQDAKTRLAECVAGERNGRREFRSSDRRRCVRDEPTRRYSRTKLLSKLKELIDSELTEKQWTALTAELGGMPLPQLAEKLGSNTNSIYKLLHDARKKLRRGLEASGFTVEDVREAWA